MKFLRFTVISPALFRVNRGKSRATLSNNNDCIDIIDTSRMSHPCGGQQSVAFDD